MRPPRRHLVRYAVIAIAAVLVPAGLVVALSPSAQAETISLAPSALTTIAGSTGDGQTVANLVVRDLSGKTDAWHRYVEFKGQYSGYLTFTAPPGLAVASVTGLAVQINYRGPAKQAQTWTFSLYDSTANSWVPVGSNKDAPDWGAWKLLTLHASGPYTRFFSPTGALPLRIVSSNDRDAANLDYVAIELTSPPGTQTSSAPSVAPASATPSTPTRTPAPSATPTRSAPAPTPSSARPTASGGPCPGCWHPAQRLSWNWVISTVPKAPFRDVDVYDIDGFEATAADVAALHHDGKKVICYISAGSYENWRSDAKQFPSSILGNNLDGWPGERWLDIRDIQQPDSVLARIMNTRLDMCRSKGFDAVEFDNIDGYTNRTGLPLTASNQLAYNRFLANGAHARGLSAAMKNDVDQIDDLVSYFDLALNEECNAYNECGAYRAFVTAGKPVLNAEYGSSTKFCTADNAAGISGVRFALELDDSIFEPCR